MNHIPTSTYYLQTKNLFILPNFSIDIEIENNDFQFSLDKLVVMAARINKKRSFLFVSKVLGKHIPVHPKIPQAIGLLLAAKTVNYNYSNKVVKHLRAICEGEVHKELIEDFIEDENPIVIGFAETATALGHSFAKGYKNGSYIHSTREVYENLRPTLTFEEEHSHATSHYIYCPNDFFENERELIFVDDELTTGQTNLNIIRSIHAKYPRKKYKIISILDWRTEEHIEKFKLLEQELSIMIEAVSLIKGQFTIHGEPVLDNNELLVSQEVGIISETIDVQQLAINIQDYYHEIDGESRFKLQGRFALTNEEQIKIDDLSTLIASQINGYDNENVLCIGTGEFMYLPMNIASKLKGNIFFQSTTRSPIYPNNHLDYGAKTKIQFPNFKDKKQINYLYNLKDHLYSTVVLFLEEGYSEASLQLFISQLANLQPKKLIKVVF